MFRKDYTNCVFGEFTVTEMLWSYKDTKRTYCKCIDKNRKEYIIRTDALVSGATKHAKGAMVRGERIDITNKRFGKLVAISPTEQKASNGNIKWLCQCDCGNQIIVQQGNLERKHTTSCGCEKMSLREKELYDYLKQIRVNFVSEKRFKECTNKKGSDTLPFDFYLESYNTLIEYDGEHHYTPIKGWGGIRKYNQIKENDAIKEEYCRKNNIKLVRIPYYYSKQEVKQTIDSILQPATTTV